MPREIPLFYGQKRSLTQYKALVDDDVEPFVLMVSPFWFIHSIKEPKGTPRHFLTALDSLDQPYPINVLLNRLCYLLGRHDLGMRRELCLRENFPRLWGRLLGLPRIKHFDGDKLNCLVVNLNTTTTHSARADRLERVGTVEDIVVSQEEEDRLQDEVMRQKVAEYEARGDLRVDHGDGTFHYEPAPGSERAKAVEERQKSATDIVKEGLSKGEPEGNIP